MLNYPLHLKFSPFALSKSSRFVCGGLDWSARSIHSIHAAFSGADDREALLRASYDGFVSLGDSWSAAFAARYLAEEVGSETEAVPLLEESYERFTALGDRWNAAFSMYYLSGILLAYGRIAEGIDVAWNARDIAEEIGDVVWHAHATRNLGIAARQTGDHEGAREYMKAALDRLQLMGDDACTISLNGHLACVEVALGDTTAAVRHVTEAMRAASHLGSTINSGIALWRVVPVLTAFDDAEQAVRVAVAASAPLQGMEDQLGTALIEEVAAADAAIGETIDPERREQLAAAAEGLSVEDAIAEVLRWSLARTRT